MNKIYALVAAGLLAIAGRGVAKGIEGTPLNPYLEPRVGVLMPTGAKEQNYNPFFTIGAAAGVDLFKVAGTRVGIEATGDYFRSSAEYIETDSVLYGINVTFSPLTEKVRPYALVGPVALSEFSKIRIPKFGVDDRVDNTTFGARIGFGAILAKQLSLEAACITLIDSGNVRGMVSLTAGAHLGE
jgi:hypothetical protein